MKTVYCDMDGVLVKYKRELFVPGPNNETPPFLVLGSHVFLNLEPEENMLTAFNMLYNDFAFQEEEKVAFKVLTGIPVGLLQAEHTLDKFAWCVNRIDNFREDDFFCTSVAKHDAVSDALWTLTENDYIIEDYPKSILNWRDHGGTPIKFINGINSVNPRYECIYGYWSPEQIVAKIKLTLKNHK